ncbi:Uncharacterised protein r2_g4182 [Pycnogonum litorale]
MAFGPIPEAPPPYLNPDLSLTLGLLVGGKIEKHLQKLTIAMLKLRRVKRPPDSKGILAQCQNSSIWVKFLNVWPTPAHYPFLMYSRGHAYEQTSIRPTCLKLV